MSIALTKEMYTFIELSAFVRENDEQVKIEKKDKFLNETLPFYMKKFDAIVKENKGYLANGKVSSFSFIYFLIHNMQNPMFGSSHVIGNAKPKLTSVVFVCSSSKNEL